MCSWIYGWLYPTNTEVLIANAQFPKKANIRCVSKRYKKEPANSKPVIYRLCKYHIQQLCIWLSRIGCVGGVLERFGRFIKFNLFRLLKP